MSTIDEMAWEAHEQDRSLPPKYQTPDNCWIDWFGKGYCKARKQVEEYIKTKASAAFCATMQAGPTGCDRNKAKGCRHQCPAFEKFIQKLNEL